MSRIPFLKTLQLANKHLHAATNLLDNARNAPETVLLDSKQRRELTNLAKYIDAKNHTLKTFTDNAAKTIRDPTLFGRYAHPEQQPHQTPTKSHSPQVRQPKRSE